MNQHGPSAFCIHGFFHERNRLLEVPRNVDERHVKNVYDFVLEIIRIRRFEGRSNLQNMRHVALLKPVHIPSILQVSQVQSI